MKQISLGDTTVFISSETLEEYQNSVNPEYGVDLEDAIQSTIWGLFHHRVDPEIMRFLKRYQKKYGDIAILDAHGHRSEDGVWLFFDQDEFRSVQSWVDEVDGKFGVLVLLVCDTNARYQNPPTTNKSILVVGDGIVHSGLGSAKYHSFQYFHPTYGEITGYTVDDAVKSLLS